MPYVELIKGRTATKSDVDGKHEGQRIFYEVTTDPEEVAALPVLYSTFPTGYSDVTLRLKKVIVGHIGANEDKKTYTLKYTDDVGTDDSGGRSFSEVNTERSIRVGGSMIPVDPKTYEWDDNLGGAVSEEMNLFKRQVNGTISCATEITALQYASYIQNVIEMAGKVNSDDFMGFSAGLLMFVGCDLDEFQRNNTTVSEPEKFWKVTLHFSFMIQEGKGYADAPGPWGWNYFFDPDVGFFRTTTTTVYGTSSAFASKLLVSS